ncbi:type II secretion system protein GspC [Colwelliaceae bacterium BS250]
MDLALLITRLQALWARVPQQQLTKVLIIVLLGYVAFWFADFTWKLVPQENSNKIVSTNNAQSAGSSLSTVNASDIKKLNLFGQYNQQIVAPKTIDKIESAPETKLRLTLTGVVASDDPTTAAAIIESKGQQDTYGIDDNVEGTRAILKQIYNDRVILESSGRMETLMLDGFDYTKGIESNAANTNTLAPAPKKRSLTTRKSKASTFDPEKQARMKERVAKARADILENPSKLTDYIKISPYRKDGKVKGYRLMPNKDPEFFTEVGLVAGDIAVQINGKDLTDMRQAQQALIELRKAEHVDVLVERNGELHDISLGLK